jgi:AcrR family transcriptional regulator
MSSQRERLLRAMAEVVSEDGYEATTIPQVIARARVSTNTFYAHFEDKTACFIALCEQLGEQLFEHLASLEGDPEDPADALAALNRGIEAYVRWWPDRPAVARAYFIELPAAGPRAIEERERQYRRFETILRDIADRARALDPSLKPLREAELTAASVVARELVAEWVRAGRLEAPEEIEAELRYLLLKLLVSEEAARQAG